MKFREILTILVDFTLSVKPLRAARFAPELFADSVDEPRRIPPPPQRPAYPAAQLGPVGRWTAADQGAGQTRGSLGFIVAIQLRQGLAADRLCDPFGVKLPGNQGFASA